MLDQGVAPVVIVINNGGYTTERAIHRPTAAYHRIPAWDWTTVPAALARGASPLALRAATEAELRAALSAAARAADRPVLIEAVLDETDAPPMLLDLARLVAAADSYASN